MNIFNYFIFMTKTTWHYAAGERWKMLLIYLMTTLANVIYMLQPYVIGQFINTIQTGSDDLLADVQLYLGLYALAAIGFWVFQGPSRVIETALGFNVQKNMRTHYYQLLGKLPLSWHHDNHSGNTVNRINKCAMSLEAFAANQFHYIEGSVRILSVFVMLTIINFYVMVAALILAGLVLSFMTYVDKFLVRQVFLRNEKEHEFSAQFFDFVSNILNVISFNLQKMSNSKMLAKLSSIYPHVVKRAIINEVKWCGRMIFMAMGMFLILYGFIAYHEHSGLLVMAGTVVMIFQYMERVSSVLNTAAEIFNRLAVQYTDCTSVLPIEQDYRAFQEMEPSSAKKLRVKNGEIAFNNVNFSYHNNRKVFSKLNLIIQPQEKVGLIGVSGAGKTTLINLLLRSYQVDSGSVSIDGTSIKDVSSDSLLATISLIPQDTSLFEATVLENIRYGRNGASRKDVLQAAKKAHVDQFAKDLPQAFDTYVGERGVKLSGGQRQRVAIARAILKDAPILILDEATSALDSESEQLVQASLKELMANKTVVAIAHRLSTIKHLDRLIVMDKGKIVEDGTHEELLKLNGHYAKLWQMQSGGFIGG